MCNFTPKLLAAIGVTSDEYEIISIDNIGHWWNLSNALKIMFYSTISGVPDAFYRIRTQHRGLGLFVPVGVKWGCIPDRKCFRAFLSA